MPLVTRYCPHCQKEHVFYCADGAEPELCSPEAPVEILSEDEEDNEEDNEEDEKDEDDSWKDLSLEELEASLTPYKP